MNKISDVMEDIKQNITDNQYKIIMDSFMEIKNEKEKEERVTRLYYSQQECDEMTKEIVKLTRKQFLNIQMIFMIVSGMILL